MPLTPGTNCITQVEDKLIDMIADCVSFRTWTGSADAAAAKTRIHLFDVPGPADDNRDEYAEAEWIALFPHVVVSSIQSFSKTAMGNSGGEFDPMPRTHTLQFQAFADRSLPNDEACRQFRNAVGDVIVELMQLSGTKSYLDLLDLADTLTVRGNYPELQFQGDILSWTWTLTDGVEQS